MSTATFLGVGFFSQFTEHCTHGQLAPMRDAVDIALSREIPQSIGKLYADY